MQLVHIWENNDYEIYAKLRGSVDDAMDRIIAMPSREHIEIKLAMYIVGSKKRGPISHRSHML